MALKLTQSLKQSQHLMMTPQLQQAIKLLTLTHLELTNTISDALVDNPVLEENIEGSDGVKSESDYKVESLELQTQEAKSENFSEEGVVKKDDFDWDRYIESYNNTSSSPPSMATPEHDELPNYENIASKGETLIEHLLWQARMETFSDKEHELASNIIQNINDDGYLDASFEEIMAESNLDREACFSVLSAIQKLEPVGCGAENLVDCLLAQARIAEERSPLLEKIIRDHLHDLRCNDFGKIAQITGVSSSQVKETSELLHQFYPKPGRLISSQDTHYIIPDIYVIEVGGEYVIQLNDEGVPRLKISQFYKSMLKQSANAQTKEYVQDKLRSAMWLIKSIQNRQRTIFKVTESIVHKQQSFFKKGPEYLKPMVLKDVANEIGMHESTVSRVTTNKYMHTPIGTFELKYFFNSGVGGKNGGVDISSEVLKIKIKSLIDNEQPRKPLSDQKIATLLSREDVKVARRTVAKYREIMGILSSSQRKLKT